MSKTEATPRPWEIDGFNNHAIIHNEGSLTWPQWKHVGRCDYGYADPEKYHELNKANAELIVKAVNNYDRLVKALERVCESWENSFDDKYEPWYTAKQLLKELSHE